jgi:hypothetical protein
MRANWRAQWVMSGAAAQVAHASGSNLRDCHAVAGRKQARLAQGSEAGPRERGWPKGARLARGSEAGPRERGQAKGVRLGQGHGHSPPPKSTLRRRARLWQVDPQDWLLARGHNRVVTNLEH